MIFAGTQPWMQSRRELARHPLTLPRCQLTLTKVNDPAVGLRAVRALQRLQERLEAIHVANAREQGWSWQAIADALGVSRQAVHQKYNRRR